MPTRRPSVGNIDLARIRYHDGHESDESAAVVDIAFMLGDGIGEAEIE